MINTTNCKSCGSNNISYIGGGNKNYICDECGFEKIVYTAEDICYLVKSSVSASVIIDYIENVECTCDTEFLCDRCDLLDRMNAILEDINDIVGI